MLGPVMPATASPFDAIGEDLAKVLDIKRWLIESGIRRGDPEYARGILDDIPRFVRSVRDLSLEGRFIITRPRCCRINQCLSRVTQAA
jgi:hypothetical protein